MSDLLKRIDEALYPHFDSQISTWSSHHRDSQHESESADCDPAMCFETITICNGCGTSGCTEPLAGLMRELRPIVELNQRAKAAESNDVRRHEINLRLPDDCAVVTAELIAITYICDDGTSGYAVVTRGEMPMTTYLGLATLAESYILGWRDQG